MTHYLNQTKTQAAASLREFLDERAPALDRPRGSIAADGRDPHEILDGTVESFVPLWRWILSYLSEPQAPGATDPASVPRKDWPSWERYTMEEERVLSFESLVLLDGLISYLAAVVANRALSARWDTARHRIKRYAFNNHPVLVSENTDSHIFLPAVPAGDARAVLGMRQSPDHRIAGYARAVIDDLSRAEEDAPAEIRDPEPLVEVEDLGEDALRRRELEVSLLEVSPREDIAHENSGWWAAWPKPWQRRTGSPASSVKTAKSSSSPHRVGVPGSFRNGSPDISKPNLVINYWKASPAQTAAALQESFAERVAALEGVGSVRGSPRFGADQHDFSRKQLRSSSAKLCGRGCGSFP